MSDLFKIVILSPNSYDSEKDRHNALVSISHGITKPFLLAQDKKLIIWLSKPNNCFYMIGLKAFKRTIYNNNFESESIIIKTKTQYKKVKKNFYFFDFNEKSDNIDYLLEKVKIDNEYSTIFAIMDEDFFYESIREMKDKGVRPDLVIQGHSGCENSFKKIIENQDALIILHPTSDTTCYSNFIKLIYDEKFNFKKNKIFDYKYPITIISKAPLEKKQDGHKYSYNPISKIFYLSYSDDKAYDKINESTYKLIDLLNNPINIYFSYGSTTNTREVIDLLKDKISFFFPFIKTFYDKQIENFNQPLDEYEEKLTKGDIIIIFINKKYLYSRFAMRELAKIYSKYNHPPKNLIYIVDLECREILKNSKKCDKLYSYWKNQISNSELNLKNLLNDEAKNDEKNILYDYHLVNEKIVDIIKTIRNVYDHKSIDDHISTNMSSPLWFIYDYLRPERFDLYNNANSVIFEKIVYSYKQIDGD